MAKLITTVAILLLITVSCKQEKRSELTNLEKEEIQLKSAQYILNEGKEKLVLLANIKQIPYDSLYLILQDYYFKTDFFSDASFDDAISYTAAKHSYSKKEIATIVFNFKYEMLTKEEIYEENEYMYPTEEY